MKTKKRYMSLSEEEQRIVIGVLNEKRCNLLRENKPTEPINELLLKTIDAPTRKEKNRSHEAR